MEFVTKFQYTEEEVWADTEVIVEMQEDFVVDVVKNEEIGHYRIPFAIDPKEKIIKYKLEKNKRYKIDVYPPSGWIEDDEIDELNACKSIEELINVGFFINIKEMEEK